MILKKDKIIFLLTTKLAWLIIILLGKLTRIRIIGRHHWDWAIRQNQGIIVVTWHGRLLLPVYIHRDEKILPMISLHRDGEIIAQTVERLGYKAIRGSSSHGGREAYHEMLSALKEGQICAILPDGPKGPRHKLKSGVILLAHQANAIIVPMTFSSSRKFNINSWDQFVLWKPFSQSIVMYDKPIEVPKKITKAEVGYYRRLVEGKMIELEQKADRYFQKK